MLQFSDLIVPPPEIAWKSPRRKSLGVLRNDESERQRQEVAVAPSLCSPGSGAGKFAHVTSPVKFSLCIFVALVAGIVIGLNLAPVIAPQEEQRSEDYQRLQKSYWHTLGQLHKEMNDQILWEPKENPPKEEDRGGAVPEGSASCETANRRSSDENRPGKAAENRHDSD